MLFSASCTAIWILAKTLVRGGCVKPGLSTVAAFSFQYITISFSTKPGLLSFLLANFSDDSVVALCVISFLQELNIASKIKALTSRRFEHCFMLNDFW